MSARLRHLKEGKAGRPPAPRTVTALETSLLWSVERLDRGAGVDGEAVFRRLRKRIKEHRSRG